MTKSDIYNVVIEYSGGQKEMKKLLALLLSAVMIFSAAVPALAADETPPEKGTLSDYRFRFFTNEEAEQIAQEIAQTSWYSPLFLEPDTESVVISVDLRAYPELSNIKVLVKASRAIVDRSSEFLTHTTSTVKLLDYSRFAGELALHVEALMLIDFAVNLGIITDTARLYEIFEIADMNLDEERISPFIMEATGTIVMNILGIIF